MEFTPQILDTILNLIQGALNTAIPFLEGDTRFLFQSFLVISIVFSGVSYTFGNTSAGLEFLLKKILLVGFALFLVTNWLDLTNIVISSFGLLGLRAGGVSGAALTIDQFFSPGSIMTLGFGLADQLSEQADNVSGLLGFSATSFFLMIAAFFVALAFVIIALQVFMTLIEFKLVTLGGFILLPFALLDRTTSLAQGALSYVIAAGLKLFALAVVVSFAFAIFPAIQVPEEFDTTTVVTIIGVALTFLMLAIRAPGLAASMISGGPQLGVGAIAQAAATAVGAGATVALSGAAAYRAGSAVTRTIGQAGASKGQLQVAGMTSGRSSPAATMSTDQTRPSNIRSDAVASVRHVGRAGIATGVAMPRSDGTGGSATVDLSDKK